MFYFLDFTVLIKDFCLTPPPPSLIQCFWGVIGWIEALREWNGRENGRSVTATLCDILQTNLMNLCCVFTLYVLMMRRCKGSQGGVGYVFQT